MAGENEQHIYHHNDNDGIRINLSIEKNTRGFNYSVTVVGARTVEEGTKTLDEAETKLKEKYGNQVVEGK